MQFRHQMDKNKQQTFSSGLYLVSTPIGNMEDITFRALNVLKNSDIVLCEDTRRSGKLLSHFQIKSKLLSYHKFNEKKVSYKIIDSIKKNKVISLITDAGTPTISDPGMILVNKCIEENLSVYPIPGSSAATSAVSVSGFSDQYLFYGFLTKKENELENTLKSLCNLDYSIVFFIPAPKINFYISQFKKYFFDRKIVIAREMTKIHEEFIRGKVESIKSLSENLKGELTVVLSEKIKEKNIKKEINESVKIEIKKMLKKYSHKDVVEFISKKENLPKRIIYNYCLKLKK
jgi:16S rRNA (cytidine1402-2'-O)-methyltransferase